jgi:hypothetical protein
VRAAQGQESGNADPRRSHGETLFASMIEPLHFGYGRQATL